MLQQALNQFIHKRLAREVEWNCALARQFGFKVPTHYEFGFAARMHATDPYQSSFCLKMTLRLDDHTEQFNVAMPASDFEDSDDKFIVDLFRCAGVLVARYIEVHPELGPDSLEAGDIQKKLQRLGSEDELTKRALEIAESASYSEPEHASKR